MLSLRPINLRDIGETEKDSKLRLASIWIVQKKGGDLAQDGRDLAFDRPNARPFKCFFHRSQGGIFCVLIRSLAPRLATNYIDCGSGRRDRHRQLRNGK